jgi:hypothetical protein
MGGSICEHNRQRHLCLDCGGSQICSHQIQKASCKVCDPAGHLRLVVANRVRDALDGGKEKGTLEYLGCNIVAFRAHIEAQFQPGMTWENHGKGDGTWQIDHIIPIKYPGADGDPPTLEEVASRLHYTNTQPMWTTENIAKGNRFIGRPRQVGLNELLAEAL